MRLAAAQRVPPWRGERQRTEFCSAAMTDGALVGKDTKDTGQTATDQNSGIEPAVPATGAEGAVVMQEPVEPLLARRRAPPPAGAPRECDIALRAPLRRVSAEGLMGTAQCLFTMYYSLSFIFLLIFVILIWLFRIFGCALPPA